MNVHPLMKLAHTKPYTVSKRVLAALRKHRGHVVAAAKELGAGRMTVHRIIDLLGIRGQQRKMRDEARVAERAEHRAGWALRGHMLLRKQRAERAAARAAAPSPTGGTRRK